MLLGRVHWYSRLLYTVINDEGLVRRGNLSRLLVTALRDPDLHTCQLRVCTRVN